VQEQEAAGYRTAGLRVVLQKKIAWPAATLVLVLVGIPFAFTTGRRGALYGMGIAVILAVVYYAALATFTALGSAELLPPAVAAWAPNALFALGGLYLMLHVRT
jgi:lipopolysaccharide export LptBFGC system permease protein LptF